MYQGDSGTYSVVFIKHSDNLKAFCNCPAGMAHQYCKHRFALMQGDNSRVISDNKDEVMRIPELLKGTDVEKALNDLNEAEILYEEQIKAAKKALIYKKKALARAMLT
jgi:uncharacterized Zn finger protein